jgi:hypothetical protein
MDVLDLSRRQEFGWANRHGAPPARRGAAPPFNHA